jgi:hypothetical protein
MLGCNGFEWFLGFTSYINDKANFTKRTAAAAVALLPEFELIDVLGVQRAEPNSMGNKFVGKRRGVLCEFAVLDSKRRDLGDHRSTQSVGKANARIVKLKLDCVKGRFKVDYSNLWCDTSTTSHWGIEGTTVCSWSVASRPRVDSQAGHS